MDVVITSKVSTVFCCLFLSFGSLFAISVGSDTAVSREARVIFLESEDDNKMNGFAAFEDGFTLQTVRTSCTWDCFFPVSGEVDFGGGSLYLFRDLVFDNGVSVIYIGSFYGNGNAIYFPESLTTVTLPAARAATPSSISELDSEALGSAVVSVDWSYDDQHVSAVAADNYLHDYSFNGSSLSFTYSIGLGETPFTVRNHPSSYFFAVGVNKFAGTGDELRVYELSGGTLSLNVSYDVNVTVNGVGWSYDGGYLAAGYDTDVEVFSFSSGVLTPVTALDYGGDFLTSKSIAWDQTGGFFAAGTDDSLRIFYFDGATITATYREIMSASEDVNEVDWSKTGSWIAIGTDGASDQVRVYLYDSSSNTLTETVKVSVATEVHSVHWNSDATRLVVGTANDVGGTELKIFSFDQAAVSLTLDADDEITADVNDARWSHDDEYIAIGTSGQELVAYDFEKGLAPSVVDNVIFNGVSLIFTSDIVWHAPAIITGDTVLRANGHKITFSGDGSITVTNGAQLTLEDLEFVSLGSSGFACETDDSSVILRNCKIYASQDFSFYKGSMLFDKDVVITGPSRYIYSSKMTSTIAPQATLFFNVGATFCYHPPVANKDLFYMTENSSRLRFNSSAMHATSTGIRLTRGAVFFENKVTLSSDGNNQYEAIEFGDGNLSNDVTINILSGAEVNLYGPFCYNNVN